MKKSLADLALSLDKTQTQQAQLFKQVKAGFGVLCLVDSINNNGAIVSICKCADACLSLEDLLSL